MNWLLHEHDFNEDLKLSVALKNMRWPVQFGVIRFEPSSESIDRKTFFQKQNDRIVCQPHRAVIPLEYVNGRKLAPVLKEK